MSETTTTYWNNTRLSDLAYARMVETADGIWQVDASQYSGTTSNPDYDYYNQMQNTLFNSSYQVKDYLADPNFGIAVMLIEDSSGHKTLAVRGTDSPNDAIPIASIVAGIIPNQVQYLENYYNRLKTEGRIAEGEQVTITGHSLGGAVAQIFTYRNQDAVDHAYSVNGPGILGPLTILCPELQTFPGLPITNLISDDLIAQYGIKLGEIVRVPARGHSVKNTSNILEDFVNRGVALYPEDPQLQFISSISSEMDLIQSLQNLFTDSNGIAPPPRRDPLMLDLDGDGIETVASTNGAYFDHDGNGFAERTGWAGSDDGLLVLDRDSDGIINNGTELFGDQTILQNGQTASNGFQALAEFDANSDGRIDANDAVYTQLKIWQDLDGDGYSQADEMKSLSDLGIAAINTGYTNTNINDGNGNTQVQAGTFEKADSTTGQIGGFMLQRDTAYTIAGEWLDVPEAIAVMPDLQGYGNVLKVPFDTMRRLRYGCRTIVNDSNLISFLHSRSTGQSCFRQ